MSASDWLFVAATLAWCQAMPLRLLVIYAIAVCVTAVGKWWLT
jgi:hypothetical protein